MKIFRKYFLQPLHNFILGGCFYETASSPSPKSLISRVKNNLYHGEVLLDRKGSLYEFVTTANSAAHYTERYQYKIMFFFKLIYLMDRKYNNSSTFLGKKILFLLLS